MLCSEINQQSIRGHAADQWRSPGPAPCEPSGAGFPSGPLVPGHAGGSVNWVLGQVGHGLFWYFVVSRGMEVW